MKYQDGKLEILDQRLLPNEAKWLPIGSKEAAFEAIQTLAVRGAPAIGIFAAFSMALFGKGRPGGVQSLLRQRPPHGCEPELGHCAASKGDGKWR